MLTVLTCKIEFELRFFEKSLLEKIKYHQKKCL